MRNLTLGIALSALIGSLAAAQSGTTNGNSTGNCTGNSKGTKTSNGQTTSSTNGKLSTGGSVGTGGSKGSDSSSMTTNHSTSSPTTALDTCSSTTSNSTMPTGQTIAQTLAGNENLDTLESLLSQAGLSGTFSGNDSYTVFAPTDAAFSLLGKENLQSLTKPENSGKLSSMLTYHVVPGSMTSSEFGRNGSVSTMNGQWLSVAGTGGGFSVQNIAISQTDIKCSNGVIHLIDAVLMPTESNLVEVAGSNGSFGTFLKACKAAGLDATLVKNGDFTVFAPTDAAFAKLPAGTLEMLMQPENRRQLREILSFHIVPGDRVFSNGLTGRSELQTVLGDSITVESTGGTVTLANGSMVKSDLQATNGVLHGVDSVLMPGTSKVGISASGKGKPSTGATATGQDKDSN